jgi:hypothetical protein
MKNRTKGREIRRWRKQHGYRTRSKVKPASIQTHIEWLGQMVKDSYEETFVARMFGEKREGKVRFPMLYGTGVVDSRASFLITANS